MYSTKMLEYGNQNMRRQAEIASFFSFFYLKKKKNTLEEEEEDLGMRGGGSRGEGV